MNAATQLAKRGVKIFRAGIWKPRTKPGGFEGIGVEGLGWMQRVKQETGMYVTTEVATAKHVEEALKAGMDMLWIGARTSANPFAMQELADSLQGVDIPVLVKNPALLKEIAKRLVGEIDESHTLPYLQESYETTATALQKRLESLK
jgi:chorismate mutase